MLGQESQFHSVLDGYPADFCSFCERATGFDGWSSNSAGDEVELYCDDCGHRKYTLPWVDVMPDLRAEIRHIMED